MFEESYDDSYISRPEIQPEKPIFGWQYSLGNSQGIMEEWKVSLELDRMSYLKKEAPVMRNEYLSIKSAYQIRMLAFCRQLQAELHEITLNYHQAYLDLKLCLIHQLDAKLAILLEYMRDFESNMCDTHHDVFGPLKNKMYFHLEKCALYCLDIFVIDDLLSLIEVNKFKSCYEASYGTNQLYYDKQIRKIIRKNPEYSDLFEIQKDYQGLIKILQRLFATQSLPENKKSKYIQVVKGQFYSNFLENNIVNQFFRLSIHSKYCFASSQAWDQDHYQELCLQLLKMVINDPKYTVFLTRIDPQSVNFLRRRFMKEFLISYNKIITSILNLQQKQISKEMNVECLQILLSKYSVQFIEAITIFYDENKKAYSIKDQQLHQILIKTLEKVKHLYLSFTKNTWILPTFIFNRISNQFFIENLDTLSSEIEKALPSMINRLHENDLPSRVVIRNGSIEIQKIEKLQYLFAIKAYIKDCVSDNVEELDLPELKPYDFETTILYISTISMKFNYNDPNEQQKQSYVKVLDECIEKYKVEPELSWYQHKLKVEEKKYEFQIIKQIKYQWARNTIHQLLNLRDQRKSEKYASLLNNKSLKVEEVIQWLKYSIGIHVDGNDYYFNEEEGATTLIDMKKNLSLCNLNEFNISLEDQLKINQIHICLFFNNKIVKEADKLEIYREIVLKIVLPWMGANEEVALEFKKKYPKFFQCFLVGQHLNVIGEALIKYIKENESEIKNQKGILSKIQYFQELIENGDINQEIGEKMISNFLENYHFDMNMKIVVSIVIIYLKFVKKCPKITQKIQLYSFIPPKFVLNNEKFAQFLSMISTKQGLIKEAIIKTILNLLPKLYNQFHESVSIENLCSVIKIGHNLIPFLSVYSSICKISEWNDPYIGFIQGIVSLYHSIENIDQKPESLKLWTRLEHKAESINVESKDSLVQLLGKQIMDKISGEIKKANTDKEKDKYGEIRILQSIIWKIKCRFDDILQFTDLSNLLDQPKARQKQFLIKWMLAKQYKSQKHQILHKGISKLPVLRECCEEVVRQFLNGETTIYPEHIYKLIFINNKYSSEKVQKLILSNIEKFDEVIGMKIHQKYLVRQIKRSLNEISSNFLEKVLYSNPEPELEKTSVLFKKLLCLPISDFKILNLNPVQEIKQVNEEELKSENVIEKVQQISEKKISQIKEQECSKSEQSFVNQQKKEEQQENQAQDQLQEECIQEPNFEDDGQQIEESEYQEERPQILQIFYAEDRSDLPKYKDYVQKRQILNVIVEDNYRTSLEKHRNNPEYEKIVVSIVKVLRSIESEEVKNQILSKIPSKLFEQLKHYELENNKPLQKQNKLRQQEKRKPNFNEEVEDQSNLSEERYDFDEEQESESISDFGDEWGDFGLEDDENEDNISEDLEDLNVPDFKKILSSIQQKIQGDEFTEEQMTKILEISLLQLFHMPSAQLKLKAVNSFYHDILQTKVRKTYLDSLLILARIDEVLKKQSVHIYKLIEYGISPRRALDNFLAIILKFYQDENDSFYDQFVDNRGKVLKTADKILSSLPEIDNILSILLFYCKIKNPKTHSKIDQLLRKFSKFNYSIDQEKAKILTTQIYQSENSSSIWRNFQDNFSINISEKIQFFALFHVYSSLLRNDLADTLEIMYNKQLEISLQNQMKIAENLLKIHEKKIKHFFFWNRNFCDLLVVDEEKTNSVMKNQKLIKLIQLMFFYLKDLKVKFFEKTEEKTFNKIIMLPKNIIQIPFLYFDKMEKNLENWRNPLQIHNFFEKAKCGETHFSSLMDVSNLILFFLDIPLFSSISLKNKIIPYFMDHQEGGRQLPLVFKTPAVQQPSGQRLFLTRQCSFDMSFYQITGKAILVEYRGEEGSDYGGMIREFMMGWQGKGIGEEYFYFGRLFGISFKRSIPYGGEFDLPMAIAITGFVPDLEFVKEHDTKLYTSLNFILDNDVEDLELRFVISKNKYGVAKQFPLKENGQQIEVTNQNKQQYIDLYIKHAYSCGRQWQLSEIQAGFYSIVNRKYAEIFHPVDLIHKIRGEEIHDYMKLKKKARYEGYTATTPIIKWFWQIISTFDQKGLNKFIQFLTGAPKISIYDPHFKITIEKNYTDDEQKLPVAHTCFNTLDLPQYPNKQILENKITIAIFEGNENFGLL